MSALVNIGHAFRKGSDGTTQNHLEALHHYQLAASQGDAEGEAWVAHCYLFPEGMVKSHDAEAYRLSKLGVQKNIPLAVHYYRESAQRGSQLAFQSLKNLYDEIRPHENEFHVEE